MRGATRIASVLVVACCLLAAASSSALARSSSQYRIEGRGFGHGIGMSQYGAQGYAQQGWTYDTIISHYYTGTVVAPRPDDGPTSLRVLLQSYLAPARLEMLSPGFVQQGVTSKALLAGDIVEMRSTGAFLITTIVRGGAREILTGASAADATIVPEVDGGVKALFKSDYAITGATFRGTFTGHRFADNVSIVNNVPVEQYLRGVVPAESPSSWNAEALKAQAVAARGYALTGIQSGYNWFDVYSDTQSQVYGGIPSEKATTDAAILATADKVARIGGPTGPMARTYFFSTSAGRTAANEQVWSPTPIPYLRSVPSPYETASPSFVWKGSDLRRYRPTEFAAALGGSGALRSISQTNFGSGYVKQVRITRAGGAVETVAGEAFRNRLGLKSSWFRIQLLTVKAPTSIAAGGTARITGRAPKTGITTLVLERDGYRKVLRLKPTGALGAWGISTKVPTSTYATIMRNGVQGPRIHIDAAGTVQ